MPVTVVFDVEGMSSKQYDAVIEELEAAGEGTPPGRLLHVASSRPGGWSVVDVWESEEALGRFAQVLMPLLVAAGVDPPPQPTMLPTHNIIGASS